MWTEDKTEQIEEFVKTNPLTANIREKFLLYDKTTNMILNLSPTTDILPIAIDNSEMIKELADHSKEWKTIMGQQLSSFYKTILQEIINFINDQQKILQRPLKDLDDVRIAMNCQKEIRENFIRIDGNLTLMEDTYGMFHTFDITISAEDMDGVDSLRYNFKRLLEATEKKQFEINDLQKPLLEELTQGKILMLKMKTM